MRSALRGKRTSGVEVTNVSPHGFWLLIVDREMFVSFKDFPWFKDASIGQITNVELPSSHHLHWPEIDVDLAVDSLEHPERYPLVSRARADMRSKPRASRTGSTARARRRRLPVARRAAKRR